MPRGRKRGKLGVATSAADASPLPLKIMPQAPLLAPLYHDQQHNHHHQFQQQQSHPHPQQQQSHHQFYAALTSDQELLDDFCTYLENRVLAKNLALLRRILGESLLRREHTLTQFKSFGANLVAVLPFDITDESKRRRAEQLLQKRKPPLMDNACVFEFLFARVATKNLALLKQMFVEFRTHVEDSLSEFVKRGVVAVSVIPFDPPAVQGHAVDRFAYNPMTPPFGYPCAAPVPQQQPQPQYQYQYPPQPYMQHAYQQPYQHPVQYQQYQQAYVEQYVTDGATAGAVPGVTPKHERAKKIATVHRKSHPAQDLSTRSPIAREAPKLATDSIANSVAGSTPAAVSKRAVKKPERYFTEQDALTAAVVTTTKRTKREQMDAAVAQSPPPQHMARRCKRRSSKMGKRAYFSSDEENDEDVVDDSCYSDAFSDDSISASVALKKPRAGKRTLDFMIAETLRQFEEHAEVEAEAKHENKRKSHHKELKEKKKEKQRIVKAKEMQEPASGSAVKTENSWHWTRLNSAAHQLKVDVRDKLRLFEKRQPWLAMYTDLPLPFDELQAPRLAEKLRAFWKMYARAVWERSFWMPLAQDGESKENVQRKARQRVARLYFDSVIWDAYRELGAEFFVQLDEQRHPGWWYRRPILDILAYHRVVGDSKCWEFVETQLYERFPDCGLELPLKSPNYGVLRRQRCESASMWSTLPRAAVILEKIIALKSERAPAKPESSAAGNGDPSGSGAESSAPPAAATVDAKNEENQEVEAATSMQTAALRALKAKLLEIGDKIAVVDAEVEVDVDADIADDDEEEGDGNVDTAPALHPDADGENADDRDGDNDEDSDDEMNADEKEEQLIKKIALASSLESDSLSAMASPEEVAIAKPAETVDDTAASSSDDNVTVTAGATGDAGDDGAAAVVIGDSMDKKSDVVALESELKSARIRELESARIRELIRKIVPLGDK